MPTVNDILKRKGREVHTIAPGVSVLDATKLMNEHRIGALLVVENDAVVGMFTERDVLTRIVAVSRDPAATKVSEVMTTPVAYCTPESSLEECSDIFTARHIRHLPVLSENKLMGVITSGDLLAFETTAHQRTIYYLEAYIQGP
ncbi:histidine kinase [candidate division BRC1 bacterium HGW-BRC1-1]|jgi:CBS domain-containing protein|nr:MAG: histidine kinase [candidate division BRC1 bacterium HGW-BRC1-1]